MTMTTTMKALTLAFLLWPFSPFASATCPNSWTQFHQADMQRANPCETTLTPANAGKMVERWRFATGGWVRSSPAVAGGIVYVGSYDGAVYAFKAGKMLWQAQLGLPVLASPAVSGGESSGPMHPPWYPARQRFPGRREWRQRHQVLISPA